MNKYLKEFLFRGVICGGFGPIVVGIVYAIVGYVTKDNLITTNNFLVAILSSYVLAFLVAGSSMFYQIEHWGLSKAILFHILVLYISYLGCYLLNSWLAFNIIDVLVFTGIFIAGYLLIWLIIYISIKHTEKKLNKKVEK